MLSRAKKMSDIAISGQFTARQVRCNADAKLMCDLLQLPERSSISTSTSFMETQKLTICCLNIQSLNANLEDLKSDHSIAACNLLFLSETWLETEYPVPIFLQQFVKAEHLREGRGRGVSVFSTRRDVVFQLCNSMIEVTLLAERISLIALYRTHNCSIPTFINNLKSCITENTAIIMGDFNCPHSISIEHCLNELGFQQVVASPTHRAGNKLDLCFVRYLDISSFIHPCYFSHHDCLCVTVNNINFSP